MAVGQGALLGGLSYLAVGREIAFGTAVTCTAGLDFLSSSLKMTKEMKILEQIENSRTYSKSMSLSRKVEGEIEFYYAPTVNACNYLLQNAMGGTVTSATATGETAGGAAFTHTFNIGMMDQSYTSLSISTRKGDSSGAMRFKYKGCRVGEMNFKAEIDEPLMCSASIVAVDATTTATDVSAAIGVSAAPVLSFDSGRFSVENSLTAMTTTSYWHVQSVEMGWNNSLKSDKDSRRIGSDVLGVLPPGMVEFTLKAKVRFDTLTAYNAMMGATVFAAQLEFLGPTLTTSLIRQGIRFDFPKVVIADAGDPEISGPDEILTSDVVFKVLRDDSSATGYAMQVKVTNARANYT